MTNREHYKEQIIDICAKGMRPIIDADGLTGCSSRDCTGCPSWYKFGTGFICKAQVKFSKWLEEEYEPAVDWSKVPVDAPILVKDERSSDKWFERHFAYYQDGKVYAWNGGRTSYTSQQEPASVWQYAKLYKQETE
jgi:hypothetical protein